MVTRIENVSKEVSNHRDMLVHLMRNSKEARDICYIQWEVKRNGTILKIIKLTRLLPKALTEQHKKIQPNKIYLKVEI